MRYIIIFIVIALSNSCQTQNTIKYESEENTVIRFKSYFSSPDTYLSKDELTLLNKLGICSLDSKDDFFCDDRKYEIAHITNSTDSLVIIASFSNQTKLSNSVETYVKKGNDYKLISAYSADLIGFWIKEDRFIEMVTRSFSQKYGYTTFGHKWNGNYFAVDTIYSFDSGRLIDSEDYFELKKELIDQYPFKYKK